MTAVVIFRASDRAEVGAMVHLPAGEALPNLGGPPLLAPDRPTVLRTLCGQVNVGRLFDREGATCAFCLALSGQHPGGNGKRYLTRWHRSTHPHVPRPTTPEEN